MLQKFEMLKFGEIASLFGIMTEEQIASVIYAMEQNPDKRNKFGDTAVEMNYINQSDIEGILNMGDLLNKDANDLLFRLFNHSKEDDSKKNYYEEKNNEKPFLIFNYLQPISG